MRVCLSVWIIVVLLPALLAESKPEEFSDLKVNFNEGQEVQEKETVLGLAERSKKITVFEASHLGVELSLERAKHIVLTNSKVIFKAKSKLDSAKYQKRSTFGDFLPTIDLSAAHYDYQKIAASSSSFVRPPAFKQYQYGLRASYSLYEGLSKWSRYKISKIQELQEGFNLQERKRYLIHQTILHYFAGVTLLKNIEQAQRDLEFEKENLKIANHKLEAGIANMSEVLNFKLRLNQVRSKHIELTMEWDILIAKLAALFSVEKKQLSALKHLKFSVIDRYHLKDLEYYLTQSKKMRKDYEIAKSLVDEAKYRIENERSNYHPKLSGFADYSNTDEDNFGSDSNRNAFSLGLELQFNLFKGFKDHFQILKAKKDLDYFRYDAEDIANQLGTEVESEYLRAKRWLKSREVEKKTKELAGQKRDIVLAEYRVGKVDVSQLNEAQNELSLSETQYIISEIQFAQALEILNVVVGDI